MSNSLKPRCPSELLKEEFEIRRGKNPLYSMNAFAKAIGVSSGYLSEVFSGKKLLTSDQGAKIANRLGYSEEIRTNFLSAVDSKYAEGRLQRNFLSKSKKESFAPIAEDQYRVLADWYHFAILNLIRTNRFENDPCWIGERLGITPEEAESAMDRLCHLGFIGYDGDKIVATQNHFATSNDIASAAIRKSHKQILQKTISCLDAVDVEKRNISCLMFPADMSKLQEAKELLRDYSRKVALFLEQGDLSEVYCLNVQLVPLTQLGETEATLSPLN
ncbi:MAG: TIGR02147 family protein [Oligoflexales bacterium]